MRFTPDEQKAALLEFTEHCNTRIGKLSQDELGNWRIVVKRGSVYAGAGFYALVLSEAAWEQAQERLPFGEIVRPRVMHISLPSPTEIGPVRTALGLSRKHL